MIRISPGRPLTSTRLFVEVCARIDVHAHLPEGLNPGGGPAPAPPLSVEWSDHPGRPWTTVNATVAWTPQRLGGTRAWWVCPGCRRRCRFLLSPGVKGGAKLDHDGGGTLDHLAAGRSV